MISVEYTTGLHDAIHLSKKLHKHLGEGSRNSHCVKKGQDNWPNVNKDTEGLSYMSDFNHLFVWITKCGKFLNRWDYQTTLPVS